MNASRWASCGLLAALTSIGANAAVATINAANIDRVRIFNTAYGSYSAGDFDLVLLGEDNSPGSSPPWPAGLACTDHSVVTTHRSSDTNLRMLASAEDAQSISYSRASITISDDPHLQAYPGRCSLIAIKY